MSRHDALVTTLASRPVLCLACLAGIALAGAVVDVLLRPRCDLCRERVRIPMHAHVALQHAGDA